MSGGKREGAGRPAPLGRKETCTVRLTPDAAEFCRQHPDGFPVLEEKLRKSKEFRDKNCFIGIRLREEIQGEC